MFPTSLESLPSLFLISLKAMGFAVVACAETNKTRSRKGSTYTVTYTCIPSLPSCQNLIWICKHRCLVWFMSKQQEVAHTNLSKQDQQLKCSSASCFSSLSFCNWRSLWRICWLNSLALSFTFSIHSPKYLEQFKDTKNKWKVNPSFLRHKLYSCQKIHKILI